MKVFWDVMSTLQTRFGEWEYFSVVSRTYREEKARNAYGELPLEAEHDPSSTARGFL